jgi:L-fuconolactonase
MRVLDSHLHLWDPAVLDYDWLDGPLRRRFGPREFAEEVAGGFAAGFSAGQAGTNADAGAAVFVEADAVAGQSLAEVDWAATLSESAGIRGIVARAALERGDAVQDELDALRERPLVVGVRRLLQSQGAGFAVSPGHLAGARRVAASGLTLDAGVRWTQLPDVAALADAVPGLTIILDHLGKPPIGSAESPAAPDASRWLADLRALAERPGAWCKVSGLPAESPGGWTPQQVTPFLDAALEAFGPERLMFGSDWPVSSPYGGWLSTVAAWAQDRIGASADALFWTNAERAYGLGRTS